MSLPLVPAVSQFDGGAHESSNCSMASGARLMRYATGIKRTGSQVRAQQSDQVGGTSIPDVCRATHKGWSFEPYWAAPNDTNAGRDRLPVRKDGDWIGYNRLRGLLLDGNMVIVQGEYGKIPDRYTLSDSFNGGHAFTVDAYNSTKGYYVCDTLFHEPSPYDGQWLPSTNLHAYAYGLAGSGRIYAAWAKPLPDTGTGGDMDVYEIVESGPYPCTVDSGAKVYDGSGKQTGTLNAPAKPFWAICENKAGTRVAIHGDAAAPRTALGWVDKSKVNRR
jgi:hypothetical protein